MNHSTKDDMLKFLSKSPMDIKTIRHYFRTHDGNLVRNLLIDLQKARLVTRSGKSRKFVYDITDRGRLYLKKREEYDFIQNLKTEMDKYLILNGGYD